MGENERIALSDRELKKIASFMGEDFKCEMLAFLEEKTFNHELRIEHKYDKILNDFKIETVTAVESQHRLTIELSNRQDKLELYVKNEMEAFKTMAPIFMETSSLLGKILNKTKKLAFKFLVFMILVIVFLKFFIVPLIKN